MPETLGRQKALARKRERHLKALLAYEAMLAKLATKIPLYTTIRHSGQVRFRPAADIRSPEREPSSPANLFAPMRTFYFDLHNSTGFTVDEEGQLAPDEHVARAMALENIRSVLSSEVRAGTLDLTGRIDIRRDNGEIAMQVGFDEAIRLRLP